MKTSKPQSNKQAAIDAVMELQQGNIVTAETAGYIKQVGERFDIELHVLEGWWWDACEAAEAEAALS